MYKGYRARTMILEYLTLRKMNETHPSKMGFIHFIIGVDMKVK